LQQATTQPAALDVSPKPQDSFPRGILQNGGRTPPIRRTPGYATAYPQGMRFFEALATAFFRTFGITQPTDQMLRRAVWFLFALFALIFVAIGTATVIIFHSL
jgi:hypothetical protein